MLSDFIPENSSLLVSAHADNKLLFYNGQWSEIALEQARGIAVGDLLAIVGNSSVNYYRADGSKAVTLHTAGIQGHEAVYDGDGQLWVTAPVLSSLLTIDAYGTTTEQWRIPGVDQSTDSRSWINGVASRDGTINYVTTLGIANTPAGWRAEAQNERGALIDVTTSDIVLQNLFMPHSPRWYDNKLWLLNSGHGELCTWEIGSSERNVIATFEGFSRGLLLTDTHALIGISQGRITAFPNLTIDPLAQPGIAVVELASGTQVHFEPLDVQEIFDIQAGGANQGVLQ